MHGTPCKRFLARLLARDSLQETRCKRLWQETPCFLQGVSCKESLARYYDKGWAKTLLPATIRTPKHAAPTLPHNNQQTNADSQGVRRHDNATSWGVGGCRRKVEGRGRRSRRRWRGEEYVSNSLTSLITNHNWLTYINQNLLRQILNQYKIYID